MSLQHAGRLEARERAAYSPCFFLGNERPVPTDVIHAPVHLPARPDETPLGYLESATEEEEESDNFEDLCGLPSILLSTFLDTLPGHLPVTVPFCVYGSRSINLRAVPLRC
jgi:hypothetical protein